MVRGPGRDGDGERARERQRWKEGYGELESRLWERKVQSLSLEESEVVFYRYLGDRYIDQSLCISKSPNTVLLASKKESFGIHPRMTSQPMV